MTRLPMERPDPDSAIGDPAVSLVIPCLNEAVTLPYCIANAKEALARLHAELGLDGEIVVADNGSSDGSPSLAESLGARVVQVTAKGYGNALIGGINAARGRFIVMADADGSYDFREAVSMVARLRDGYDLCMGSRFRGRIVPGAMPWKNRWIGNPVLTGILNLLFRSGLSDAHCGLRAFTRQAFDRMQPTSAGMEFASEMAIKASLLGLRRTEVPVTLHPDRRDRAPHLRPWRDGWRHLRYLLMLSPMWLFLLPSAVLGGIGAAILLALVTVPADQVLRLGPVWFGDHWSIIAAGLVIASHQTGIFGLASTLLGVREGYRKAAPSLLRVLRLLRLENMLAAGLLCIATGGLLLANILMTWTRLNFGQMNEMCSLALATVLAIIGIQTIFGGFLLSIIAGNQAKPAEAAGDT